MHRLAQAYLKVLIACALCDDRRGAQNNTEVPPANTPAVAQSDPTGEAIEQSLAQLDNDMSNTDTLDDLTKP